MKAVTNYSRQTTPSLSLSLSQILSIVILKFDASEIILPPWFMFIMYIWY